MLVFKAKNYIYIQLLFFFIGLLLANDFVWSTNTQKRLQWLMSQKLLRDRDNFFCFVWWKLCEENGNNDNEDLSNNNKILWESWLQIFKPKRILDYNTLSETTAKNGRITSPYFLSANDGWMYKQKYVSKNKFSKRTILHNRVRDRRQTNKTFKNLQSGKFSNKCLNEKYKIIARECFEKISTLPSILSNGIDNIESSGEKKTILKCIRNYMCNKKVTNFAYNCLKTIFDRKTLNYSQLIEQNDELKIPSFIFNLSSFENAILKLRFNPNPVFHPFSFHKYFANNLLSHKTVPKFRGRRLLGFPSNDFLDTYGNNQFSTQDGMASFRNDIFNKWIQNNKNASITNETNFNFQSHLESKKYEVDTNAPVLSHTDADITSFLKPSITLSKSQFFQMYKPENLDASNSGSRYLQKSVGYTSELFLHFNDFTANFKDKIKPTPVQRIYQKSNNYSFRNSKKLFQYSNSIKHALNLKDEISVIQSLDKFPSLSHLTSDITQMTQLPYDNDSFETTSLKTASHQIVQSSIALLIGSQNSQNEAKIAPDNFDYSMQSGDRLVSVINLTSGVSQMTQLTNDNDSFETTALKTASHQIVQSSIASLIDSQNEAKIVSDTFDYSMQSDDWLVSEINLTSGVNQMTQLTNENDSFVTTSLKTASHQIVQSSIASLIGSQNSQNEAKIASDTFDYSMQSGDWLVSEINLTSGVNQMTQLTNDNDSFETTSLKTASHQIVQSSIASLIGSQNEAKIASDTFDYSMQSGDWLVSLINLTSGVNQMTQLTNDNDSFETTSLKTASHQIVQSSIASLIGSQNSQNEAEIASDTFDYSMQSGDWLLSEINLTSGVNQMTQLTNDNDSFETTSLKTASHQIVQSSIASLIGSQNEAKIVSDTFDYSMQSDDWLVSEINLTSGVNQMTQLTNDNDSFETTSLKTASHQIVQSSIASLIGSQNAVKIESGIFDYSVLSGDRQVSMINLTSEMNHMIQLTNDIDSSQTTFVETASHQFVQRSITSHIGLQHSQNEAKIASYNFDYSMQSGDRLVSVINLISGVNQMTQLMNDNDSFETTSVQTTSHYNIAQHLIPTVSQTDLQHSHNVAEIESDIFDKDYKSTIQPYQTMKHKWKSHLISSSIPLVYKDLSISHSNYSEKLNSTPTVKLNSFTSSTLKSSFTLKVNLTQSSDLKYRVILTTAHSLVVPGAVLYESRKDKIHEIYSEPYSVPDENYYFATSFDIVGSVETYRANDETNDSRLKTMNSVLLHETRSTQTDWLLNKKTTDFNLNSVINAVGQGKGILKLSKTLTQNTFSSEENHHSNIVNLSEYISGNENQNQSVKLYSDKYPDMNFSRVRNDFNGTNQDNFNLNEHNSNSTNGFLISTGSVSSDKFMSSETDFLKVLSIFKNNHTESVKGNLPHGSKFNEERISPVPISQIDPMSTAVYITRTESALDVFSTDALKVNFDENNNLILSENPSSNIDVYLKSSLNFKQNNGVENNFYATEGLNQMLRTFTTVPTELNTQIFPTQHLELSRSPYAVYQGKTMGAFLKETKSLSKLKKMEITENVEESTSFQDIQQVSLQTQLTEINHDNKRHKPSSTYVKEILKQISRSNHVTNVLKSIEASGGIDFGMDTGMKIKSSTNKDMILNLSTFDNYEKLSNDPNTEHFSSVYVTTTEEVQKNSLKTQDEKRTSTPYNNNVAFTEYNLALKTNSAAEGNIVRSRNDVDDKVIGNINSNNKANNNLDNSAKSLFQKKNESLESKLISDENNYVIKRNDDSDSTTELELLEITEKENENTSLSKNGIFLTPDSEENALIRTEREILSPEEEFFMKSSSGKEKIENARTPLQNSQEDLKNLTKASTNTKLPSINIENINDTNSYFNATDNSESTGITHPPFEENFDSKNKTLLSIKENSKSSNDEDLNEKFPFFDISINDDRDRDLEKYLTSNLNVSVILQPGSLTKQIDGEWKNMSYKEGKSNVLPSETTVQVKNLSRIPVSSTDILIEAEKGTQSSSEENLTDFFSDIYKQVTKSKNSNVQIKPKNFTITKLNRAEFDSNIPSSTYISNNSNVDPNFDQINEIGTNPNIASKFEKNNSDVNSHNNGGYHSKAVSFTTVDFAEQYNSFEKETEAITYGSMYESLTNSDFEIKQNKIFHDANSETESSEKLSLDIDDNIATPELIKPTQIPSFFQPSGFELTDKSSLKSVLINENNSVLKFVNTKFLTTTELATTEVSDSFGQGANDFSGLDEILNDNDFKIKPIRTSHYESYNTKSLVNTLFDGNDDIVNLGLVEPILFLTSTQRLSSSFVDKFLPTPIEGTKTNDKESFGIKSLFTKLITPSQRTVDTSDASANLIPITDLLIRNERETESSNEEVLTENFFNFDGRPVNKIASSRDLDKQLESENNLVNNDLSKFSQTLLLSSLLFPSSKNLNSNISLGNKINLSDIEIKANASTKLGSEGLEINFTINGNIHIDGNKQTLLTTPKSSSKSDNAQGSVNEIITNTNADKNTPSNDFSPGRNEIDETKYKKELSENPLMDVDDENLIPDDFRTGQNDKTSYTTSISFIEHDFTLGRRDEISTEEITNYKIPEKNATSGENKNERNEVHHEGSHGNQAKIEVDNESLDTELVNFDDAINEKDPMLLTTPKSYIESDDTLERGDTVDTDEIVKDVLSDNDFPLEKYNSTREEKNKRESQINPIINLNDKSLSIESVKSDDINIDQNNQILSTTSSSFIVSDDALKNRDMNTAGKILNEVIPSNDFSSRREKTALDSKEEVTSSKNPLFNVDNQSISFLFVKPTAVNIFPEKISSTTVNSLLLTKAIKKVKNIDETYTLVPVFTKHLITSQTTTEIDDLSRNLISSDDATKNSIAFEGGSRNSILTDDVLIRAERETQSSNEEILTEPISNVDDIFDVPDLGNPEVQPKEENLLTTNSISKIPLPDSGLNLPLPVNTSNVSSFGHEFNINGMGISVNASTKMGSGNLDVNFNIDDVSNKDDIPEKYVTTPKLSVEIDSILGDGGVFTTDKNKVETLPDSNIQSKGNKLPRDLKDEQDSLEITTGNKGEEILNPNLIQPTPVFNFDISSVDLSQFFPHLPIKTSTINLETAPRKSVYTESVEDEEVYSDSTPEVISKDITNENKISTQKDIVTFSEPSSLSDDVDRDDVDDSIRTSTTSTSTVVSTESSIIPFHFTIDADYKEVVGTRKKDFEESLTKQLGVAMRVPIECVQNLTVTKGSIQVDFNLVPSPDHGHMSDEKAMKAAADELKRMIDNGLLNINDLDGNTLVVVPLDPPTMSTPASEMEHTTLILGVIIGAFILTVIAVVISAIVIKRKSNGISRLSPIEEARSKMPSYRDIPFQEALFMKNTVHNKLMLGKYNYDTGKWVGPGPEPKAFRAPDSVVYRPPTDSEIRRTPRPPTAVRERLKNDWELDWDSTVFSR